MNPVDQVRPLLPSNWVRRPDERRRRPGNPHDTDKRQEPSQPAHGDGEKPPHIIDDLA